MSNRTEVNQTTKNEASEHRYWWIDALVAMTSIFCALAP